MAVRPIDANAMLNELRPVSFESEHSAMLLSDVSKMMREWVERQPTLTPPNEWVSVDEGLPEPTYCVLVYTADCSIEVDAIGSDGEWMSFEVTHWMPLPEPPGEDNNAQSKAPNEPLTQADLDKMDYDKVWIDYEDDCGEWALVCNGYIYAIDTLEGAGLEFGDYMRGEKLEPHGYKVYRRPPERQEAT